MKSAKLACLAALALATLALTTIVGCDMMHKDKDGHEHMKGMKMSDVPEARAMIKPSAGNSVTGMVRFFQQAEGVKMVADLKGLPPNSSHGIHIHEKADLSAPDLSSAGGHWNPTNHMHAGPKDMNHHAGDLGNIKADDKGNAHAELMMTDVSLNGSMPQIVGHSVIIHAKEDDLKTQPSGASGDRIGGGLIEIGGTGAM